MSAASRKGADLLEAKADALREAADKVPADFDKPHRYARDIARWLRDRADQIEGIQ